MLFLPPHSKNLTTLVSKVQLIHPVDQKPLQTIQHYNFYMLNSLNIRLRAFLQTLRNLTVLTPALNYLIL